MNVYRPFAMGIVVGGIVSATVIYLLLNNVYEPYLVRNIELIEKSSSTAFTKLDPTSNKFVQHYSLMQLNNAYRNELLDKQKYRIIAARFMTRMCIGFEDEGNMKTADKACLAASVDLTKSKQKTSFEQFKEKLIKERHSVKTQRKSGNKLEKDAAKSGDASQ